MRTGRHGAAPALALVAVVALSGCTTVGDARIVSSRPNATASDAADPTSPTAPTTTEPTAEGPATTVGDGSGDTTSRALVDVALDEVMDVGGIPSITEDDALLAAATADIDRWAHQTLREVYSLDDDMVLGGIHAGHPDRGDPIPGCGEDATDYRDLTEYVALYCRGDDFIAFDAGADGLLGSLVAEHGPLTVAVVIAHEYGHAIQDRIGALDRRLPTVVTEQQADCFAGAWLGQTTAGRSTLVSTGSDAVRAGLIALINVRDPIGVATTTPGGHGTAFDRVGAFQEGFAGGATACAPLLDEPRDLMPNEFTSFDDYLRAGNAPYDCDGDPDPECAPSWEFLGEDLDEFWSLATGRTVALTPFRVRDDVAGGCDEAAVVDAVIAVCRSDATVRFDERAIRPLYADVGDFTLGYLLGAAWVEYVLGPAESGLDASQRVLRRDCLTGVWVADITTGIRRDPRRASTVVTSPGDLDEAITTLITLGDGTGPDPFDRIAAFRSGVLDGPDTCD